ncbi:MAG: hypothetical protein A2506_04850 [Elusimicrobia bacterium RIFOXYD12_FULL_66_9]|nr:MAG: hypothetical protein A2506_04850 [Elusimicrobia bacterium RIFOXYD12_FULL_66_9]
MTNLLLAAWAAFAVPAFAVPDDATAKQIVDYALRTPTAEMDPTLANAFLDLDLEKLPKKKKEKAQAKKLELQTLLKISAGKKKGGIRWPTPDGCKPKIYGPGDVGALAIAGFEEIKEDEESFLEERTKCSELELCCEFSLTIALIPQKKGPPLKLYFLHANDPINVLLAEYRNKNAGGQTKFFGGGVFSCNH